MPFFSIYLFPHHKVRHVLNVVPNHRRDTAVSRRQLSRERGATAIPKSAVRVVRVSVSSFRHTNACLKQRTGFYSVSTQTMLQLQNSGKDVQEVNKGGEET